MREGDILLQFLDNFEVFLIGICVIVFLKIIYIILELINLIPKYVIHFKS